jgi:hypothetical protein
MSSSEMARLTFLVGAETKSDLERLCAQEDLTVSQLLRRLIASYLDERGANVTSTPSPTTTSSSG